MTPKEKAENILNKYRTFVVMWSGDIQTTNENVKQCALITVDECIKLLNLMDGGFSFEKEIEFWEQVRNEINAL